MDTTQDGDSAEDREGGEGEVGENSAGGGEQDGEDGKEDEPLPTHGYTTLLSLTQPNKQIIIRREDGFEKRGLWRCGRCAVVVGYEVFGEENAGKKGKGKEVEGEEGHGGFEGKILYLLRGGLMSTKVMADGKKVTEQDAGVLGSALGVWE